MWEKYIKRIIDVIVEVRVPIYILNILIPPLIFAAVLVSYLIFNVLFNVHGLDTAQLSAAMTFTLLVFMVLYIQATWGIVNETKKDRQIRFIEKRLEKLYYPLRYRLMKFELDNDKSLDDFAFELMDSFSKYTYLASGEFASIWDGFIERWDMDLYPNIEKQIEKDIEKYKRELNDLIRR